MFEFKGRASDPAWLTLWGLDDACILHHCFEHLRPKQTKRLYHGFAPVLWGDVSRLCQIWGLQGPPTLKTKNIKTTGVAP
jgi:hypothetical protein